MSGAAVQKELPGPARAVEDSKEPSWLSALKREALEVHRNTPLPERVAHLWRYTDPKLFEVETDARVASPSYAFRGASKELIAMELEEACRIHGEKLRAALGRIVPASHGRFEALNLAFFKSGAFVYVPRGFAAKAPLFVMIRLPKKAGYCPLRVLLVAEEGSALTLVTELTGGGAGVYANVAMEFSVAASCAVNHVNLQRCSAQAKAYVTARADLGRGTRLLSILAAFGGGLVKSDTGCRMRGEGAEAELLAFAFGEGSQHFDHRTVYEHLAPHSRSNLNFKAVLKDGARSAYTGLIRIVKEAAFCEAYQENRNVLLSGKARAESIPELEIMTEEVQCKHGSTTGPLDEASVFYLMSRGLSRQEAVRTLVAAFFEPTLTRIPSAMQTRVRSSISERLKEF